MDLRLNTPKKSAHVSDTLEPEPARCRLQQQVPKRFLPRLRDIGQGMFNSRGCESRQGDLQHLPLMLFACGAFRRSPVAYPDRFG